MATYPPKFEQFWAAYPRKVAKPAAARAWEKQGMEDDLYAADAAKHDAEKRTRHGWWPRDKTKIPHPSTWINARRWEDEGWEDECGSDDDHVPVTKQYEPPPEPERQWTWYEIALNRLGKNYMLAAGGLSETDTAINVRDKIIQDDVPAYLEEIDQERMTIREAALELGKLFLRHLDSAYRRNLAVQVYKQSLLPTDARHKGKAA